MSENAVPDIARSPGARREISEIPEMSLPRYLLTSLENKLHSLGDKPWVVDLKSGVCVRFSEVEEQSRRVASALTRLGFVPGDVLAYLTHEVAHLYVVLLAVWRLGGAATGLFYQDTTENAARTVRACGARFLLTDSEVSPLGLAVLEQLEWPVTLLSVGPGPVQGATPFHLLVQDDATAYPGEVEINPRETVVLFVPTSGSTGPPKLVVHTHYNWIACIESVKDFAGLPPSSFMSRTVNFAIVSNRLIFLSLYTGCTLYLIGLFQEKDFLSNLMKYKPEVLFVYPHLATWLAKQPRLGELRLDFLRMLWIGGWVLDPATYTMLRERLPPHVKLGQLYGMSEAMVIASTNVRERVDLPPPDSLRIVENEGLRCVSTGQPLPFVEIKVVDLDSGKPVARLQRGEILVRTPGMMKRYLLGEASSVIDAEGWFRTGDLGFLDLEGHVFLVERLNFTYKCLTKPVTPGEIDSVLQEHPAVLAAGVVGIPDPDLETRSRAFVVLRSGHSACASLAAQLQEHVAARLHFHKHLHGGVRFLNALPQNRVGKLDRSALRQLALAEEQRKKQEEECSTNS